MMKNSKNVFSIITFNEAGLIGQQNLMVVLIEFI